MKVREIMTAGSLATATLDTTIEEIANMMKAEDVGAIPVLDDEEKLAGIITDRDIVVRAIAEGEDPTECTAEDILSEQLHTIAPEADLGEAIALMSQHQIRRLPVVEEEQVIGIISLGDLSVKSRPEEAGEALEDISLPIHAQKPAREQGPDEGGPQQSEGGNQTAGSGEERFEGPSPGEQVAEEEADYQRDHTVTSVRRGTAQMGSPRAESKQAGRVRKQSQKATARGRQDTSARGRDAGSVRGKTKGGNKQGTRNRSSRQENQRQQKVAPMRAESKAGRTQQNKRRAS